MKKLDYEKKLNAKELSREEMQNIQGGGYWEVRIVEGGVIFIYHPGNPPE
jgi:bacteriocin-like protein